MKNGRSPTSVQSIGIARTSRRMISVRALSKVQRGQKGCASFIKRATHKDLASASDESRS